MATKKSKKEKTKTSSKATKKEKVSEYFEVEKDGKEKLVKATGEIPKERSTKKQIKEQNKILIGVFVVVAVLVIFGFSYYGYSYYQTNFEYRGVEFKLVKEGNLYFYNTIIPTRGQNGQEIEYNIYTRNDPREIEKEIPFNGKIELKQVLVLNSTDDFVCEGKGAISVANLANVYSVAGTKVLKDANATCDPQARYAYLLLDKGEENKIVQVSEACYIATIKDCDILPVTERFVYETLVEINKRL